MPKATARHILVSSEEVCNNLMDELKGGADFAELAADMSECPSGKDGGNLGEFGPGQMVKEFDDVVFSCEIGVPVGPVKTQFGYHVVETTKRS